MAETKCDNWGYKSALHGSVMGTLPETNIAPENQWLEDVFPIEIVPF